MGGGAEDTFGLAQNIDGSAAPDAVDDEFGSRSEAVTLPVLNNDTDADLDPLVITELTAQGAGGTFQIAPGGTSVTFSPDDSFTSRALADARMDRNRLIQFTSRLSTRDGMFIKVLSRQ